MQFHVVDIGLFVLAAGLVLLGEAIVDDDFHNVEQAAKKDETGEDEGGGGDDGEQPGGSAQFNDGGVQKERKTDR
jgi:hypothetical protein